MDEADRPLRQGRYREVDDLGNKVVTMPDGKKIVIDAQTLKEVKRIPMNKPSGKYNVGNKIEYAEGTSH